MNTGVWCSVEVAERKAVGEGRYWKVEHKILNSGHRCEITRPLLDKKADCDSVEVRELAPNTVERLGKTDGWQGESQPCQMLADAVECWQVEYWAFRMKLSEGWVEGKGGKLSQQ